MESLQPSLAAGVEQGLWETGVERYMERWAGSRAWGILGLEKFSACFVQDLMRRGFECRQDQEELGGCGRRSQDKAIHPAETLFRESSYFGLFVSSSYLVLVLLVFLLL